MAETPDTVFLRGIRAEVGIEPDAWGRPDKKQPVILDVSIEPRHDLTPAAKADDVSQTLDYGKLYKRIVQHLGSATASGARELGFQIKDLIEASSQAYEIKLHLPRANLRAMRGIFHTLRLAHAPDPDGSYVKVCVEIHRIVGIHCRCIIGVNEHERFQKQEVVIELEFQQVSSELDREKVETNERRQQRSLAGSHYELTNAVGNEVEGSSFRTVEALATAIARTVTMEFHYESVTVQVEKPNAIANIEAAGVRLTRTKSFFANQDFWQIKQP